MFSSVWQNAGNFKYLNVTFWYVNKLESNVSLNFGRWYVFAMECGEWVKATVAPYTEYQATEKV